MKNLILSSVVLFCLTISCAHSATIDETSNCEFVRGEFITNLVAPATASLNTPVSIDVKFPVMNGCGNFLRFNEAIAGNTRTIDVEAKYLGCFCTMDVPVRTAVYTFTPTTTGDYILKFKSGASSYISVTITVN